MNKLSKRAGFIAATCLTAVAAQAQDNDAEGDEHHIDEIIVRAMPLGRAVEQLAQPTSIIDATTLLQRDSTSIGETLADQLGVNSTYFGPIAARPVIRGQFGERIQMLSNGLDILDASALSEDHAVAIDSLIAERVEVIKGPATLIYGSGAAGGIINVVDSRIKEQPLDAPFSGAVSLGADSATGRTSGAFSLDAGTDGFSAHVDYFRRDTDNIEIPGFAESAILRASEEEEEGGEEEEEAFGEVENTDSETEGAAFAVSFTGDQGFAGLSVSTYESNYGVPGAHEHGEEEEPLPGEEEEEEIIRIDLEQTRYDFRSGLTLAGPIESLTFDVVVNDYEHVELEGPEVGTLYSTEGTDARLELQHAPIGLFEGVVGLQYKTIDFTAVGEEAFVPASDTQQLSLFVFEEIVLNDQWTLQGSARIENQTIDTPRLPDYDDTAFGASLGALWAFTDGMRLGANLSFTERHPNSTELYAQGPHLAVQRFECGSYVPLDALNSCEGVTDINANGELSKEFSTNLDLTLRGEFDRVEWAITGFVNDVSDYIALLPTGGEGDGLPVFAFNQGDAQLYGFEAETVVDLVEGDNGHFHTRLFADYVRGELDDGGDLPRIPPLRLGVALHYTMQRLDASVEAIYNDEQDRVADDELPTDSFTMVNASLSYTIDDPNVQLFVRGTNLADEDARRHSSPLKDFVPLPGRSVMAGLRWDF